MKSEIVLFMKRKFVVFLHIQHNRPQQVIDTTADNKQPGINKRSSYNGQFNNSPNSNSF